MFRIIEDTSDPVVSTYMRIIFEACREIDKDTKIAKYKEHVEKKAIIVSDTVLSAFYYYIRGYRKHIIWLQGIVPEESLMRNNSLLRYFILSVIEKFILKRAQMLFFVSDEMRSHYENKYGLSFDERYMIMPCFNELEIDESAFNSSNKYSYNSFVYVGSLNAWQCFDKTVELYRTVEQLASDDTKLFVFTKDKEMAKTVIESYEIKNYQIDYVQPQELGEVLNRYKYGFVLRTDCDVNRVATPTKFSNYLAHGIIPVYTKCLKSFHSINQDLNVGIVSDIDDIDRGARLIIDDMKRSYSANEMRAKCKAAFDLYYNKAAYKLQIIERIRQVI